MIFGRVITTVGVIDVSSRDISLWTLNRMFEEYYFGLFHHRSQVTNLYSRWSAANLNPIHYMYQSNLEANWKVFLSAWNSGACTFLFLQSNKSVSVFQQRIWLFGSSRKKEREIQYALGESLGIDGTRRQDKLQTITRIDIILQSTDTTQIHPHSRIDCINNLRRFQVTCRAILALTVHAFLLILLRIYSRSETKERTASRRTRTRLRTRLKLRSFFFARERFKGQYVGAARDDNAP